MTALAPAVRTLRVFQILWVIGFLIGTTTHTADLILGGLDVYGGFPPGVRLFWVTLTVLDPITAVLIILRRRAGIVLGIAVIVADIAVNWSVFVLLGGLSWFGVINQSLFAVLILATARLLWIWFGKSSTRARADAARAA
ncbi:hypothetical protein [Plantibacter sp. ME-Dv--P-122b]|uniref:hypothetical protein n=1 Tax=Plantibacter sp. ME-Dv--P-122b TaxID=3040300 RepID=UPI00254FB0DE|nr:hypothetical protein [Plantibacter sp. ME-Dv--P-122b]